MDFGGGAAIVNTTARYAGIILASLFFSMGMWMMVDGMLAESLFDMHTIPWYGYIPCFSAVVGVMALNSVTLDDASPGGGQQFSVMSLTNNSNEHTKVRVWLLFWTVVLVGSWAGAISVMAVLSQDWNGWSLMLQPFFCLLAAYMLLYARSARKQQSTL